MEQVASYFDDESLATVQAVFAKLQIPYELRAEEGDMPATSVWVPPEFFDQACDTVEKLEQYRMEKLAKTRGPRRCRNCYGTDLEECTEQYRDKLPPEVNAVYRCRKCNQLFVE